MAEEKEAFLARWSRLKREQPAAPALEKKTGEAPPALPPVESLTPESDFTGFMHPKVGDALRRAALKKLFSDPHFNIADPYEAYSGDWTVGEAIPEEMLQSLVQARNLLFREDEEGKKAEAPKAEAAPEPGKEDDGAGRQDA
jgi:hypothetical protein